MLQAWVVGDVVVLSQIKKAKKGKGAKEQNLQRGHKQCKNKGCGLAIGTRAQTCKHCNAQQS